MADSLDSGTHLAPLNRFPAMASLGSPESEGKSSAPPEDIKEVLRYDAAQQAKTWKLSSRRGRCRILGSKARDAQKAISAAFYRWRGDPEAATANADARWLTENARLLGAVLGQVRQLVRTTKDLPQVEPAYQGAPQVPRSYLFAAAFLRAVGYVFAEDLLATYVQAAQEQETFEIGEIWVLKAMMQLVLLETIGRAVQSDGRGRKIEVARLVTSLHQIEAADWNHFFEQVSETEFILRQDPSGAYARMDFESREVYRTALQELAFHSETDETSVARKALALARANHDACGSNPRIKERWGHVGYYLIDSGREMLERQINFRPPFPEQIRNSILKYPEVFYFVGIELLTLAIIAFAISGARSDVPLALAILFLLLPATESGIGIMNQLAAALMKPQPLPKLDLSDGIPTDCTTMVTIPTLLMNERQVRQLVRDLETRYLGNRDPNLHFALLTDPPDSAQPFDERDKLVELCSGLVRDLNDKYGGHGRGGFFHFHRHPVYNPSEGAWMGWERKRGKLLDFNNLLRGKFDSFPVKVGDLSVLPAVRYVLTLDSDTQLPRESAHRLIGTLAHPLNRAIIDPATNTVTAGYGVLQPRVGISVRSASQSRLASIYSGQTGFDIYSRAVSDVYQDLFREGIFTGKGIYEVEVFQQVLSERFPSNAILSHDLIEGAYTRAGLVTDAEVIDDYPSHFSAYSRRKHRWVRGDWQILRWLLPRVSTYSGKMVPNPLGVISRWKILDNLRRSLIEVATFVLLLAAWFFLPGSPGHWTIAILVLMLLPSYAELPLALGRVFTSKNPWAHLKETGVAFVDRQVNVLLWFVFLGHQTLVTLDAVVRTLVRLTVTHRRLLEWETAAEAEVESQKRTPVDVYMELMPMLAITLGTALALYRPRALRDAIPLLALWGGAKLLSRWLDQPPRPARNAMTGPNEAFLREAALRTWRFFRVFAGEEDHSLVPDNVQETPFFVAHRISPTNLGLLLNARLAARNLGFLTLPEFFAETERTLATAQKLSRYRGHFFNWYDTRTLERVDPAFVSTVDSGNLAASLWTLKQGCLKAVNEPLFDSALFRGVRNHWDLVVDMARARVLREDLMSAIERVRLRMGVLGQNTLAWTRSVPRLEAAAAGLAEELVRWGEPPLKDIAWWAAETQLKLQHLRQMTGTLAPWLLPAYAVLLERPEFARWRALGTEFTLEYLPQIVADLDARLEQVSGSSAFDVEALSAARALRLCLPACLAEGDRLRNGLQALAADCHRLLEEMDFRFLYQSRRKVFSIGYDVRRERLEESCYELLASEARTAAFVAIAKGDVPQQSWFHLGRAHTHCCGYRVLLSWTGTMFEYLMPALWMRTDPRTILDQNMRAAVACQRKALQRQGLPWGISEAAYNQTNEAGHYQYQAFGLSALALKPDLPETVVISPYSSFLALAVDPANAIDNLRVMRSLGWLGGFGFYESAQLNPASLAPGAHVFEVVRCWMAHHQGMILLSVANLLSDSFIQRLFHAEPQVAATELLLHERVPVAIPTE